MGGAGGRGGVTRPLLLDTHAFLWYATGNASMSQVARDVVTQAEEVYVSAASAWETRTKYRLGKLASAAAVATDLPGVIARLKFRPLPIEVEDGDLAGALEAPHGDPFDRMLVAQAIRRGLALVSNDAALDAFGVTRLW